MNWYKTAQQQQQQYLWDNDPQLVDVDKERVGFESSFESSGDLETDLEDCKNTEDVEYVLNAYGIYDIDEEVFERAKETYWIFNYNNEVYLLRLDFPYLSLQKGTDWIYDIGENAWQYIDSQDFNEDFWEGVGHGQTVYHGTMEDRLDDIMREGLAPGDETRGIANRSTGAAVFTSPLAEIAQDYYPVVLEINIGQMKEDGYMPQVSQEEPVEEAEQLQILANKIGLKDFYAEYEQGLDPETIIFYGGIPPKYLKVIE